MTILKKMLLSLAIPAALAFHRLVWTAQIIWLALGFRIESAPEVVIVERSVTNWKKWWHWAEKEIDETQIIDLITDLGMKLCIRAP